jgi:sugar phosphate isomerase/epimerase
LIVHPGVNLEFARSEGLGFEESLEAARQVGYEYVEPYVYSEIALEINNHLALKSASGYHHIRAEAADARGIRERMRRLGLSFSAFDAHSPLLLPQVGVPYLMKAIDLASEVYCPIVMSDEGPLPADWMPLDRGFDILCISLEAVIRHAEPKGVRVAVELHNALTTRPEYLARLLERFGPGELGLNFDTGNFFLAGNDPVEALGRIARRIIHVHAKEIPASQLHERGHVTGTRVGVAVGDGVIDFAGIIAALAAAGFHGTLGVECDTLDQAARSLPRLRALITSGLTTDSSKVHK